LAAVSGAGPYAARECAGAKAGREGQAVGGARRCKEVATNGAAAAIFGAQNYAADCAVELSVVCTVRKRARAIPRRRTMRLTTRIM
jgi:hypothetical protein